MKYRLVALDIDGTLLDSRGELRPAVREAVREVIRSGVLVTLATGRRFDTASAVAAELGIELPIVLHGGTLIQDSLTAEVLYEDRLPPDVLQTVILEVVADGHQPILYCSPLVQSELLSGPPDRDNGPTASYLARQPRVRRRPYRELGRADHVISVAVFEAEDVLRPLYERLSAWQTCEAILWLPDPLYPEVPYLLDVVNQGCSKAKAIAHLAAQYGITMEEVLAIGDQVNDLDLLTAVGLGVAMGNAIPEVQARAKVAVGTNDEDGVVEALHRFVLRDDIPA
ncbi:MAG: Cof-type HAD-IIB family hydrolase [Chloroflexota bacterium]|nr:Cof-type HAD-IIB family hydrolase [Chloroflexota bacterium]